jgi:hypothetical protein
MPTKANYPAQNAGHPKRDKTSDFWRDSVLVGPQTAGIPTVHNEDEWMQDSDTLRSGVNVPGGTGTDITGGALDFHATQRRK